ncbi:hypothetical protein [Streptosporangium oxazolinicum]
MSDAEVIAAYKAGTPMKEIRAEAQRRLQTSVPPITLRVEVRGTDASDVVYDALTQGRDFFGERAIIEIVSGDIQKETSPSGYSDYAGTVVVREVAPVLGKRGQLLAAIREEGGTWDAKHAAEFYARLDWWPTPQRVKADLRTLAEAGHLRDLGQGLYELEDGEDEDE